MCKLLGNTLRFVLILLFFLAFTGLIALDMAVLVLQHAGDKSDMAGRRSPA
jgi:hypothetical protein